METPRPSTLTCPRCGTAFPLSRVDPTRSYRCARCDVGLGGDGRRSLDTPSSGPTTAWLYGRRATEGEALEAGMPARIGRYELRGVLGRGGMGVVYRAWDPDLSRVVALKVLLAGEYSSPSEVQRFLREARAVAQLDHTHVVRVLDIGRDGTQAWFTMDLVDGPSAREAVDDGGALPPDEAARIVAVVARALHEAHTRGMVHRDVKPGNILLQVDGTPLLADFGLVSEVEGGTRITRSGQLMGTPAYMAPEQAEGSVGGPDARSDQYALGAVLYELLTGRAPYEGERAMEVLLRLMSEDAPPIRAHRPELSRDLEVIVEKAMAREPERRYADTAGLADDLERWRRGEPIEARPPSLAYRLRLGLRRRWRPLAAGAAVVLALAGGGLGWSALIDLQAGWREAERERVAAERLRRVAARGESLRSAGRGEEAERLVTEFLAAPEHRGTQAVARARMQRAREAAEGGDVAAAVEGWATAYATSGRREDQDAALLGLGELFHDRWRFRELDVVLDTLVARDPSRADDPTLRAWRARARMALRDPAGAADALPAGPDHDLLAALARAIRVPQLDGQLLALELDGTPGSELLVQRGQGAVWIDGVAGLPEQGAVDLPGGWASQMFGIGRPGEVATGLFARGTGVEAPIETLMVDDGALVPVHRWTDARIGASLLADLDGDGAESLYVGVGPYARYLLRIDPTTWHHDRPHAPLDAARSDISALSAGDYDGDGLDELAVAAGPWSAFDLRVLEGSDHGALDPVDRLAFGYVNQLETLPGVAGGPERLLVVKSDRYPSRIRFPEGDHFGRASGYYVFGLVDGALEEQQHLPNPAPGGASASGISYVATVDLDGDGAVDLVGFLDDTEVGRSVVIHRGRPDGRFEPPVFVGGLLPLHYLQLDDDPALEMVARFTTGPRDGETWVLGAGPDPVPSLPGLAPPPGGPPEGLDPAWTPIWERAEDLVHMGLVREGARQLVELAGWVPDRPTALQARYRAAQLQESLGDDDTAAALYGEAAELAVLRRPAQLGAARVLERAHRFGEALAVLHELPDDAEAAEATARIEPLEHQDRTASLVLDEALPVAVEVLDPLALRLDRASQGVRATVLETGGEALRVPFHWGGRRLRLEVELDVERVEWAGGLAVRLRGPDGDGVLGVQTRGWGGGDLLERELTCLAPDGLEVGSVRAPAAAAGTQRLTLVVDAAATGHVLCRIVDRDRGEVQVARRSFDRAMPAGTWELVVEPSRHAGVAMPMAATALLRRVTLQGPRVEWLPGKGSGDALRSVVEERPEVALPGLGAGSPRERVWRAATGAEAGAWAAAVAELKEVLALGDEDAERAVVQALRTRPATFAPLLEEAVAPEAFYLWFHHAWSAAVQAHHSDAEVQRVLTTHLGGLQRAVRSREGTPDQRTAAVTLLLARGRAWAELGSPAAARRDLRTGVEEALALLALEPQLVGGPNLPQVFLDLAVLEAEAGRPERALDDARRSLEHAAEPQIALDLLDARPELRALRSLPGWSSLGE